MIDRMHRVGKHHRWNESDVTWRWHHSKISKCKFKRKEFGLSMWTENNKGTDRRLSLLFIFLILDVFDIRVALFIHFRFIFIGIRDAGIERWIRFVSTGKMSKLNVKRIFTLFVGIRRFRFELCGRESSQWVRICICLCLSVSAFVFGFWTIPRYIALIDAHTAHRTSDIMRSPIRFSFRLDLPYSFYYYCCSFSQWIMHLCFVIVIVRTRYRLGRLP